MQGGKGNGFVDESRSRFLKRQLLSICPLYRVGCVDLINDANFLNMIAINNIC